MSKINRKSLFVAVGGLTAVMAVAAYRNTVSAQVQTPPPPVTPAPTVATTPGATPPPVVPPPAPVVLPPPAPAIGPAKIGYVNLGKLFDANKDAIQLKADLQTKANQMQFLAQANQLNVKKLVDARNLCAVGTPEWTRAQIELQKKGSELQLDEKLDQLALTRAQATGMKTVYQSISAATAKVAATRQLDLVLVDNGDDIPADAGEMTAEALGNAINSHHILYASNKIDITGDVAAAVDLARVPAVAPAPAH